MGKCYSASDVLLDIVQYFLSLSFYGRRSPSCNMLNQAYQYMIKKSQLVTKKYLCNAVIYSSNIEQ